ncbi:MAG: hypothetical protein CM15mP46_1230 [Alphaproteobacteria bacterium]|nr:MAG: hypothetical protein CM15mP46_1230 [Alphaproteobacteria bacterium]
MPYSDKIIRSGSATADGGGVLGCLVRGGAGFYKIWSGP